MIDPEPSVRDPHASLDVGEQEHHTLGEYQAAVAVAISNLPETANAGQTSRRRLLGRAVQATAATVAAGTLAQRGIGDAAADHVPDVLASTVTAHLVYTETVQAENHQKTVALSVSTESDVYAAGFFNGGAGSSVHAVTEGIGPAVNGIASKDTANPGYGVLGTGAYGVVGQSISTELGSRGVWGLTAPGVGTGVMGEGKVGVHGKATASEGAASDGYAGIFEGGKAQLRLVPSGTIGKPTTGRHQKGELYLDRNADLWVCRAGGTPGTWRKVTLS